MVCAVPTPPVCPVHGVEGKLVPDSHVYGGRSYGKQVWVCPVPRCDCRVGTHAQTDEPLGTMADGNTRKARIAAHADFDFIWQVGIMSRKAAYAALAGYFGRPVVHIGELTAEECQKVIVFADSLLEGAHASKPPPE